MKKLLAVSTAAVAVTTGVTATADAATHTVKSGDTLGSISQQYGTSVSAIKAENGLKSNLIFPNQVIKVNEKSSESTTEYTVVAGDTLGKIAAKYDVTVSQLKAWNNLSSDLIIVGQTLSLQAPAQSAEPAKAPVAQQAPVQQTQEQVAAPAQQQSYQAPVQSYKAPAQHSYQAPAQQTYKAPAQQSYQAPAQKVRTTQTSTASTGGSTKAQFLAAGGSEAMWNAIVLPESSGNPNAVSPNGYQGLGQTKESWGTGSVATQTKGMLNYAKSRYGSESAAIAFRQANGWW
ncbi:LysM peptidoglycan-binding domain-containing protein [Mammaliicoccus sciuri]|uniref:aggregation-promoting factor C-terminal-like domain-containing protein n=1 Tax=Mammaliicoccus sciuri TaxID=1296 RepID=UPI0004720FAA|nr:LysM peptidoglycan-binding domain-containing protein [Mammaliicoccus sciuri]MCD8798215.1 LysM peptidoglycan-binding domain-containing protein [Mammaliicoccus sciuri]MCD8818461.1 LysM peptidoglycan-binding domain-containing protein [Mammaliicoccus sciuri]MEB6339425.1 LysM peptidoglycan-binding domain-containing protein [Mammaliicoccus sciuri]MEB7401789.1 LysM peptidoglycan-binding domain-containing protein [Mammaliicoccus sciuri]QYG32645.1 LysM peptidoglycan-binding domain-containing protein